MLVGQKIACAALAMMIFLGISSRREMVAQEGDATQSYPLTWQGWCLLVRFLGGELTRCYRCEVLLEPNPPSGSCGWGCTQYEPIWIGKMIGVSMTAGLYKLA